MLFFLNLHDLDSMAKSSQKLHAKRGLVTTQKATRHAFLISHLTHSVSHVKMSEELTSPQVNAARIKSYLGAGHPVRVTGKVLNVCCSDVRFMRFHLANHCVLFLFCLSFSFPTMRHISSWKPQTEGM